LKNYHKRHTIKPLTDKKKAKSKKRTNQPTPQQQIELKISQKTVSNLMSISLAPSNPQFTIILFLIEWTERIYHQFFLFCCAHIEINWRVIAPSTSISVCSAAHCILQKKRVKPERIQFTNYKYRNGANLQAPQLDPQRWTPANDNDNDICTVYH
jgi:hypothetical protein